MQTLSWQPPPEPCVLLPGTVDVWRLAPDAASRAAPGAGDWRETARRRTASVLARYVGGELRANDIVRAPGGKPRLRDPSLGLGFNVSHTRGLALLAVGPYPDVGVDVEVRRPVRRLLAIAQRVLPAETVRELAALPPAARTEPFLQHWTALEARQKALGHGILAPHVTDSAVCSEGFAIDDDAWGHIAVGGVAAMPTVRFVADDGR